MLEVNEGRRRLPRSGRVLCASFRPTGTRSSPLRSARTPSASPRLSSSSRRARARHRRTFRCSRTHDYLARRGRPPSRTRPHALQRRSGVLGTHSGCALACSDVTSVRATHAPDSAAVADASARAPVERMSERQRATRPRRVHGLLRGSRQHDTLEALLLFTSRPARRARTLTLHARARRTRGARLSSRLTAPTAARPSRAGHELQPCASCARARGRAALRRFRLLFLAPRAISS